VTANVDEGTPTVPLKPFDEDAQAQRRLFVWARQYGDAARAYHNGEDLRVFSARCDALEFEIERAIARAFPEAGKELRHKFAIWLFDELGC
jgi:hypothetical protein